VLGDTDYRHPRVGGAIHANLETCAKRILALPEFVRHFFVNDDDLLRGQRVLMRELTAFEHWDADGSEVARARDAVSGAGLIGHAGVGCAFDGESSARASLHGEMAGRADGENARNSADMLINVLTKALQSRRPYVQLHLRNRHVKDQNIFG